MLIFFARNAAIFSVFVWRFAVAQIDSSQHTTPDSGCAPKATVVILQKTFTVCLNRYEAGSDSCVEFILQLRKPFCADIRFKSALNHRWLFDSVIVPAPPAAPAPPLHADVALDDSGYLISINLVFGPPEDSAGPLPAVRNATDIREKPPDTAHEAFEYALQRNSYLCADRAVYSTTAFPVFTYPPGHMRREPVYNYPELSMFHYGGSVRIPSGHYINDQAFLINYWHILHPPPLRYSDRPLHFIEREHPVKSRPKKESIIKIRPLQ